MLFCYSIITSTFNIQNATIYFQQYKRQTLNINLEIANRKQVFEEVEIMISKDVADISHPEYFTLSDKLISSPESLRHSFSSTYPLSDYQYTTAKTLLNLATTYYSKFNKIFNEIHNLKTARKVINP